MLKTYSTTLLVNDTHLNADTHNLICKNKHSSRVTQWLLLTQEHNSHLKNNIVSDTLSRLPLLDDVEAYNCNNLIPYTCFCSCFT